MKNEHSTKYRKIQDSCKNTGIYRIYRTAGITGISVLQRGLVDIIDSLAKSRPHDCRLHHDSMDNCT